MSTQSAEQDDEVALMELYDLLDAGIPKGEALSQVVGHHPTQAILLSDAILLNLSPGATSQDEDPAVLACINRALASKRPSALRSFNDAAAKAGMNMPDVVNRVDLPPQVVAKLNARLIEFPSIPKSVIEKIADVLTETTDRIEQYLRLPPVHNRAYDYKRSASLRIDVESFNAAMESAKVARQGDG